MADKRPRPEQGGNGNDHEKYEPEWKYLESKIPEPEQLPLNPATPEEAVSPWAEFSNPRQRAFLACLARTYRISDAVRAAGISYERPFVWSKKSPAFKAAVSRAKRMAVEAVESEAVRRAVIGVKKKRFYKGDPIIDPETGEQYVEFVQSDYLMARLLEATKPNKYRKRVESHQTTTIVTETPQQGQGLVEFFRERTIAALEQREVLPLLEPTQSDKFPAGSNGNGNGKHHGGNGHGGNGHHGNGDEKA